MATTLYRKYRPQKWSEITNQNHIRVTLQNELETDKISQAYLFSGPRGVGKTTTARILAKAVNCEKRKEGKSEPCNKCGSCEEIVAGRSLDIIEIDAASHTGVDNVRENIIANTRVSPTRRKFKVFIIDEVHMLSISAFNALLKTLEEPPSHVIFILATTEIHRVPSTIISRCQRFDFKKINRTELVERLRYIIKQEGIEVDGKVLDNIARHSDGSVRDAESLLGQVLSLDTKKISSEQAELVIPKSNFNLVLELVEYLFKKNTSAAIDLVNKLVEEGVDLVVFTQDLIEFLRKILLIKISDSLLDEFSFELDEAMEKRILALGKEVEIGHLTEMINLFIRTRGDLKFSEITQLPLELAIVEICEKAVLQQSTVPPSKLPVESSEKPLANASSLTSAKSSSGNELNTNDIQSNWKKILACARKQNNSLFLILKAGQPITCEGDVFKIGFRYKFHKDRIGDKKNFSILQGILKEVYGRKIDVEPVVISQGEAGTSKPTARGGLLGNILQTFGGRVVE